MRQKLPIMIMILCWQDHNIVFSGILYYSDAKAHLSHVPLTFPGYTLFKQHRNRFKLSEFIAWGNTSANIMYDDSKFGK